MPVTLDGNFQVEDPQQFDLTCVGCGEPAELSADVGLYPECVWVRITIRCLKCGEEVKLMNFD